ncbi:uncharacterized protein N7482_010351 [Penicillium canariense]|uniref:Cyclase n=1 Tax=Penicillium canariense TaxID=189055 RepID=A0A9W9HLD5_9EURO|nr:uncharacterized protein N7482_010351 [Penicillium canariense]KAJ5151099.1 hypothetical protein N7482_010351 [Penicillium canariense]
MSSHPFSSLPSFDELPPVKDMPQGCAWGVFDRDGRKDHLGCLNLLTPPVVQRALKEAKDGQSVSLNWPINAIHSPGFGRKGLEHKVTSFQDTPYAMYGFDDEIAFNTQCSSQWDSLVHFAHQPTGLCYNGVQPDSAGLKQDDTPFHKDCNLPTLNHWHSRGGLVGRGVLVDYCAYAEAHGITYDPFDAHKITVKDLEAVIKWEKLELLQGDILIVRSGFTRALEQASTPEKQKELFGSHRTVGVEGSVETARWVWNHHFAAVAGDALAFEQTPPTRPDGTEGNISDLVLHTYFLSLFGMTIGELWDLEALSLMCSQKQRYSFLLTSCPLNVPGGVGSPPNALAIF